MDFLSIDNWNGYLELYHGRLQSKPKIWTFDVSLAYRDFYVYLVKRFYGRPLPKLYLDMFLYLVEYAIQHTKDGQIGITEYTTIVHDFLRSRWVSGVHYVLSEEALLISEVLQKLKDDIEHDTEDPVINRYVLDILNNIYTNVDKTINQDKYDHDLLPVGQKGELVEHPEKTFHIGTEYTVLIYVMEVAEDW